MPPEFEIKGWCPSALRPMRSNDGLLIRARLVGARIEAAQLAAIAAIAADCGNGLVDLSQRAQLQIRGVSETTLPEALRRLGAAELLARDEAESGVNIVAAPLSNLDPEATLDADALARELAAALAADPVLRALPAKFFFAIEAGGALPLDGVAADIRLAPAGDGRVAITLAGTDECAIVARRDTTTRAAALAGAYIKLRDGAFDLRRMRLLVAAKGAGAILRDAGLTPATAPVRVPAKRPDFLGVCTIGGNSFAGVAAASGRFSASDLSSLAALAADAGRGELRVTPWRALLIPTVSADRARKVIEAAAARGLVTARDDARLAVIACPGAPECPQARGDARAALARLAPLAQKLAGADGIGLHVSGCAKGCARPGPAPVTLVARDGRFDLVDNGAAGDAPRLSGLDIDAVESALALRAREMECPTH
jgi:precorrin-3B synthase